MWLKRHYLITDSPEFSEKAQVFFDFLDLNFKQNHISFCGPATNVFSRIQTVASTPLTVAGTSNPASPTNANKTSLIRSANKFPEVLPVEAAQESPVPVVKTDSLNHAPISKQNTEVVEGPSVANEISAIQATPFAPAYLPKPNKDERIIGHRIFKPSEISTKSNFIRNINPTQPYHSETSTGRLGARGSFASGNVSGTSALINSVNQNSVSSQNQDALININISESKPVPVLRLKDSSRKNATVVPQNIVGNAVLETSNSNIEHLISYRKLDQEKKPEKERDHSAQHQPRTEKLAETKNRSITREILQQNKNLLGVAESKESRIKPSFHRFEIAEENEYPAQANENQQHYITSQELKERIGISRNSNEGMPITQTDSLNASLRRPVLDVQARGARDYKVLDDKDRSPTMLLDIRDNLKYPYDRNKEPTLSFSSKYSNHPVAMRAKYENTLRTGAPLQRDFNPKYISIGSKKQDSFSKHGRNVSNQYDQFRQLYSNNPIRQNSNIIDKKRQLGFGAPIDESLTKKLGTGFPSSKLTRYS